MKGHHLILAVFLCACGMSTRTFFGVSAASLPTTTEFNEEWTSTIVRDSESLNDESETTTNWFLPRADDLTFVEDSTSTGNDNSVTSATTDPTIIVETTMVEAVQDEEASQAQEEILTELHTIWNYTETLNDASESHLKSSLTSLVHFTYDQVVQIQPGETLGRLKALLRKLRFRLIGQEDHAKSESNRKRRSAKVNDGRDDKSLADDIEELENFLALPPFSFAPNEIEDYKENENLLEHQKIDSISNHYAKPKPGVNINSISPPSEAVIQKIIHVQDAFPTKSQPQLQTSSTSIPASISSSGVLQQSSITVKNVSGAIIPLNAEQIAHSIIKLLYQNHTPSSSSSQFSPSSLLNEILLLGEPYHPESNNEDSNFNSGFDGGQDDSDKIFTTLPSTTTAEVIESSTNSLPDPENDDDIKKLILGLRLPDFTSATEPPFGQEPSTFSPTILKEDGDEPLNIQEIINRITLSSSTNKTEFSPDLFGLAGPGNRRTSTTETPDSTGLIKKPVDSNASTNAEEDDVSSGGSSSLVNFIEDLSPSSIMMSPTALLNGTREGLVQVIQTFNYLNSQAKLALIFALMISTLSILLGVYSLGPPIIAVGVLGVLIPLTLLLVLTRQDRKSVKSVHGGILNPVNLTQQTVDDFNRILVLITNAMNKYKS